MNAFPVPESPTQILPSDWMQRWEVYHRLQSLGIACECQVNQPLRVEVETPLDVLQVWSLVRQVRASRQELIECLHRCWQLSPQE
jgi:hypothetical protein